MIRAQIRPYGVMSAQWLPLSMEEPGDITTLVEEFVSVVHSVSLHHQVTSGGMTGLAKAIASAREMEATTFNVEVEWETGRTEIISVQLTLDEILVIHARTLIRTHFAASGLRKGASS